MSRGHGPPDHRAVEARHPQGVALHLHWWWMPQCRPSGGIVDARYLGVEWAALMSREPFNPNLINVPPQERLKEPSGPLTVSQVTALVKRAIEDSLPRTLHIVGEISNFKRHTSGHLYLTLKDHISC